MADKSENKNETISSNLQEEERQQEERHRNIFDIIGDFFAQMLKGIFIFIFCKVPIKIWEIISNVEQLKKLIKLLYSFFRALILCLIWIGIVFLGWWYFLNEQFIKFWCGVWKRLCLAFTNLQLFLKANAGWMWMILALCGSFYGLMYLTLKRRKKRKQAKDNNTPKTADSTEVAKAVEPTEAVKTAEPTEAIKADAPTEIVKADEPTEVVTQCEDNQTSLETDDK